jgi:hypothetical protein
MSCGESRDPAELEKDFRVFLASYVQKIKQGDLEYLATVHPGLPSQMHGFFLNLTRNLMKHADEEGLEPGIACSESNVCTVTWPQPGGSWAEQSFIAHGASWRFLEK